MAERQEELVNEHPDEDEEDAEEDERGGEGGPQVVRLLEQQGESDDEVEAGCQQADDDQHVEDQPGEEEHPDGGAHPDEKEDGGEEAEHSEGEANPKEARGEGKAWLLFQFEGPFDSLHRVYFLHLRPSLLLGVLQNKPGSRGEPEQ